MSSTKKLIARRAEYEAEENPEVKIECDGENLFVIRNGVKIAKRTPPGTGKAAHWIPLEPGFVVTGGADSDLCIEQQGAALH